MFYGNKGHNLLRWRVKKRTIGVVVRMSILDTKVDGSNPSINMFSPWARDFIRIASVDSAVKWVPGEDNLVKGVQCYELFGEIALKIHTFSFFYYRSLGHLIGKCISTNTSMTKVIIVWCWEIRSSFSSHDQNTEKLTVDSRFFYYHRPRERNGKKKKLLKSMVQMTMVRDFPRLFLNW